MTFVQNFQRLKLSTALLAGVKLVPLWREKAMQKSVLVLVLIAVIYVYCLTNNASAEDNAWGVWTNKKQTHVYAFLKNNELKFWGQKGSWRSDIQQYAYTQGKTDGVWRYKEGVCWIGDKKQQQGNVMIYADTLECCMMAQFLGNKLVLTEIWNKGHDEFGICENTVLTKTKSMPND